MTEQRKKSIRYKIGEIVFFEDRFRTIAKNCNRNFNASIWLCLLPFKQHNRNTTLRN